MMRAQIALLVSHLIGNALLLWLGYFWLGLNESDAQNLLWSSLVFCVVVAGFVWLHALALAQFSGLSFRHAASSSARHLPPLLALTLLGLAIYALLLWLANSFGGAAYLIGSYSTMHLRRPVPPTAVERVFRVILWTMQWILMPALLLPIAAAISVNGWRGWNQRFLLRRHRFQYFIEVVALLLGAFWLPFKLFFWIPPISSFSGQMASFLARAGTGYLLFVLALLALEFFTSSGKPREIQPITVPSP